MPSNNISLPKINAFSSNQQTRDHARIQMIQSFQAKASERGAPYVVDTLINGRLFPHVLEKDALPGFLAFVGNALSAADKQWWIHRHVMLALNDHAFDQAKIMMAFNVGEVLLEVDHFPRFTPEILEFLESESASGLFSIKPFLNMQWENRAGHEGFLILLRIVGAPALKKLILQDKHYDPKGDEYSALGLMARLGLLDDFLDRDTVNLLIARGFICFLNECRVESIISDLVNEFESGRLLEILATEAKYGNASNVTEAMKTVLPYLTTAGADH